MASEDATKLIGNILNWTTSQQNRIINAMGTSAQWEIWLQVELAIFLKTDCGVVIREQRYDDSLKSLDILAKFNTRAFAIELKTESLKTGKVSGKTMVQSLMLDRNKLQKNLLSDQVKDMKCDALSSMVIGIGHASKYQDIASEVLEQAESFTANIYGEFGVYGFLMET